MRSVVLSSGLMLLSLSSLSAQCNTCTQVNVPIPFSPPVIQVDVGQDLEVEVQFTFPDSVRVQGTLVYPNYAIFVDSLRMEGGVTYVSLKGNPSTPVSYNVSNPSAGALRFAAGQQTRYKRVFSSGPNQYAHVMVYQNPGSSPGGDSPPRGCVRACIRGKQATPTADSLRIRLRAFVPSSFGFPLTTDANNKDTSNLMPSGAGGNYWSDTTLKYPVVVRVSTTISWQALSELKIYPNPAVGSASLRYTLGMPAAVWVRIYSITGQLVSEEALGERSAGTHEYPLSLPAGVYLIEVRTDKEVLREKLVLLE